jgi:O-antigen ligase
MGPRRVGGPGRPRIAAGYWWQAVLAFVVVATTLTTARDVRFVAVAFAIGSVVSVALGLAGIGGATNPVTASQFGDRLVGGGGDPNYQAAGFVGAMFVTAGLTSVVRQRTSRIALIAALVFTMIGFFATQSRGGLLALGFALITAFALFPRLRSRILGWAAITAVGLAAWLPSRPDILHRLTDFGGGASGRQDQWTIAWRIFLDHPLLGIGLDNFRLLEGRFTLLPGSLNHVHLVAETPEVVHNTYLQLLTETGVLGLIGFLAVSLGSLRAAWLAARRFDTLGRTDYANLARSILVGTIGMLAAIFFISDGTDLRLWILFALGPVLLSLANHSSAAASHGSVVYRPAPHLRGGTPGRQGVFR